MLKNIFSKIRFSNESKTYYRYCLNSFTLGYLTGCIYINKNIEREFDVLQFQEIDTLAFLDIRENFFDLLKTSGLSDDKSGVIYSFLSMNEGFKSGVENEIPELRDKDKWSNHKKYCEELFLLKFDKEIKNEFLALSDDKGAFLILRKKEFDLQDNCIKEVSERISVRQSTLIEEDKKIINFSFQVAQEIFKEHLSQLEFVVHVIFPSDKICNDRFIILRLSSLVMFICRLLTASGSFNLTDKMVQRYRENEGLKFYDTDLNYSSIDIEFSRYLNSAMPISYILKNSGKDDKGNYIFSDENESRLITHFNTLIFDRDEEYIGKPLVLRILNFIGVKVEEFKNK